MLLSVQLYSLRDPMAANAGHTLERLSAFLQHVELAGTYGLLAEEFRGVLDDHGMTVTGSHLGLSSFENDLEKVMDDHRALGCTDLILPSIEMEDYASGWDQCAGRLGSIADRLSENGFTFAYHNHAFEFENDGLRTLFRHAPASVKAQVDLGWVQHAGEDPSAFLRELGQRVSSVHLKDTKGLAEHEDVIAGEGVVDWDSVLAACTEVGVPVGTIELDDPPGDPVACVEACHQFYSAKLAR